MKRADRLYAVLFSLFLLFVLVSLYMAFTLTTYPLNYVWYMGLVVLFLFGFLFSLLPAMMASIFIVMGYGSYILYQMFIARTIPEIVLNDVVWVVVFPMGAIAAGLAGKEIRSTLKQFAHYEENYDNHVMIDDVTGFTNGRNFKLALEEEVSRSVRYGRQLTLVMIELAHFKELRQEYGVRQSDAMLRKVAEQLEEVMRDVDKKAYLGEGVFSAILPETPVQTLEVVQQRILEKFDTISLTRLNREVNVKVRLKFGFAGCPDHETNAQALYDKAKQELYLYVS
ncbi:GGDEF domain-containing protein [Paenibacillus xanthanilyticus]|uniref:GGDEF domain-containing protein n=1 Tax=Paenibacillus xanthanilyticus TaxID=1783531 RepID=A0ABV8K0Y4_9BACL